MDRFSPFFSRKWLDGPRLRYNQQRHRLIQFLDDFPHRNSVAFLKVSTILTFKKLSKTTPLILFKQDNFHLDSAPSIKLSFKDIC